MTGEPASAGLPTLTSIVASRAADASADGLIIRVACAEDLAFLRDLPRDQVAWLEVPLDLADRQELNDFSVDVILTDPQIQAGRLYRLARLRGSALPRLTIPCTVGMARAASVAMALNFPIRLVPIQPGPELVRELEDVLERYLHDANTNVPVEPFHCALAALIHGDAATLWDAVERDPAFFRREPPEDGLEAPDAVVSRLERLIEQGAECATCPLQEWCAGWFKWPDPAYDCAGVRRLFTELEKTAVQLRADLDEALELMP